MADRCHHEMKKPTINFVDAVHTIILKRLKRKRFLTVKVDGLTRIEIAVKLMDDNINVSKRYLAMNISPDFRRTLEKNISAMEQTRASILNNTRIKSDNYFIFCYNGYC